MNPVLQRFTVALGALAVIALAGCATSKPGSYILDPVKGMRKIDPTEVNGDRSTYQLSRRDVVLVQINPLDQPDAPSQFLRKGQPVQGTKFKIVDLEIKSDKIEGINKDTSVVTLENTDTKERIRLPKEEEVNSPSSYALLSYVWGEGRRLQLRRDQEFSLKPEEGVRYRLTEMSQAGATILRLSDNQTIRVPPLPAGTGAARR